MHDVSSLSNEELLARLQVINCDSRKILVALLAHLGEVEARKLYGVAGYSTMLEFCIRALGLSDRAASRRLVVARLARRFPIIFQRIERGELHLTALSLVADLLTEQNHEAILVDMIGKTTREVEELVACLAPKPKVEESIFQLAEGARFAASGARITPRSENNFGVLFNADRETVELLEEARQRTMHSNPGGSYGEVIKRSLKTFVESLRKTQAGETHRPQTKARPCKPGTVARATRRAVIARDGEQCSYVAADGTRCGTREFLQLHHVEPQAERGGDGAENLKLLCVTHHRLATEAQFGKEHVAQAIEARRQKKKAPSRGHLEGAANSAAEGGGGGGGNSVTASANPNLSSSPEPRPSSGGSAPALRATRGARVAPASPSRRTGS